MIDRALPLEKNKKTVIFHGFPSPSFDWIATFDAEVGVMGGTATEMMLERPQEASHGFGSVKNENLWEPQMT